MKSEIVNEDLLEWLKNYDGERFHGVLSDPPYALISVAKRFGKKDSAPAQEGSDGRFSRLSAGFMGQKWDSFRDLDHFEDWVAEWAQSMMRVLYPGAVCMFFGGTRTYHRLARGLERGGFEIIDCLMWLYGCLDEKSEILTESGWKRGIDLSGDERVAQWNHSTEQISLTKINNLIIRQYEGPMIFLENDNTSQLLTPNHKIYWRPTIRKQYNLVRQSHIQKEWSTKYVGAIPKYERFKLPLSGYHNGEGIGIEYAGLLAWIFTEGGFDRTGTGIRIYQSSVNPENTIEIDKLLTNLVPHHKRYSRVRTYKNREYEEITWFFTGEIARKIREDLPDKSPPWELLWKMSFQDKVSFYEASMKGDGSKMAFYQKSDLDREWFQTLLHTIGMQGRDNSKSVCVACHNNPTTELQARHTTEAIDYKGLVWCVSVPDGAFIARRNGFIFVTGNSGFPKSHDIGKAIDKDGGKNANLRKFTKWFSKISTSKTAKEIDEFLGLNSGGATASHYKCIDGEQPRFPRLAHYYKLKKWLNFGDEWDNIIKGAEREVIGKGVDYGHEAEKPIDQQFGFKADYDITAPATEDAKQWDGFGTALKPAFEPIILCRTPRGSMTFAELAKTYGTGALNIDGGRIVHHESIKTMSPSHREQRQQDKWRMGRSSETTELKQSGRWPANLLLSHHEDCVKVGEFEVKARVINRWKDGMKPFGEGAGGEYETIYPSRQGEPSAERTYEDEGGTNFAMKPGARRDPDLETVERWACVGECPVRALDDQAGVSISKRSNRGDLSDHRSGRFGSAFGARIDESDYERGHSDRGGPSRFFYTGKASRREKDKGCEHLFWKRADGEMVLISEKEWAALPKKERAKGNIHPSVKPLDLLRYLAKLFKPPDIVKSRLLVPFSGTGSEMIAAMQAGWGEVTGIEIDPNYLTIAEARITGTIGMF